jgi:hypothetical protein
MKFLRKMLWPLWKKNALLCLDGFGPLVAYPMAIELELGTRFKDAYIRGGKTVYFDEVKSFIDDIFNGMEDGIALQKGWKKRISYKLRYGNSTITRSDAIEGVTAARILADERNFTALGYSPKVKITIDGKYQPVDVLIPDGAEILIIEEEEK